MYQDEAARVWDKREKEWERERAARDRLMKEVSRKRAKERSREIKKVIRDRFNNEVSKKKREKRPMQINMELKRSGRDRLVKSGLEQHNKERENTGGKLMNEVEQRTIK